MKKILSVYKFWLLLFPLAMFFSFRPWINLGTNSTMNFEVSITLIWLALFDIIGFIALVANKRLLSLRKYWKWLLLPLYFGISILWSHDRLRASLIFAVLLGIYFAGFSIFALRDLIINENFKKEFFKSIFASSLVVCAWCLIQSILDTANFPDECTWICAGCTYRVFGFPHPNGFAVEPQFMGNLLLVPIFTAMYFIVENKMFKRRNMMIILAVLVSTLFFTLSRGAIYAFGLTSVVVSVYWFIKKKRGITSALWGVFAFSFLFTLNLQGLFSEFSPTDDTYFSGISKSVNQLTLGKIDLGWSDMKKNNVIQGTPADGEGALPAGTESTATETETATEHSMFGGYVEASTNERLNSWKSALEISKDNPKVLFFGVGFGGAPLALYEYEKLPTSREIINNQYVNTFFETGLIGVCLAFFSLYLIYKATKNMSNKVLLFMIFFAYAVTLLFFSGLPNALHIYILPAIYIMVLGPTDKKALKN